MFRYPVEIISDVYLSKIGGFSSELNENEIGINLEALATNTSIIANETTAVLEILDKKSRKPYFLKKKFLIVGVDKWMRCYELSRNGEVVMSSELEEEYYRFLGRDVLINTVKIDYKNLAEKVFSRII